MRLKVSHFAAIFVWLFFGFLAQGLLKAQQSPEINEDEIDEIFSEWDQNDSPGCAVGVYQDGEIIFSNGYGQAVLGEEQPIAPRTVFYAGSVSKQFAAAAIALLHLRGDLDVNHPVREYIPEMPEYDSENEPTVRQLVHHTSGLPDLYSLLSLYDLDLEQELPFEKMVDVITGQSHLNFEPGSSYLYSNSGYTLLAEIVERVTGQSLREFTSEQIFDPLGMKNTHFHDNPDHPIEHKALSYQPKGNESFEESYLSNFEGVGPGGLYTTVEDMMKWDHQLYENKLTQAGNFNELMRERGMLTTGDTLSYAFGLQFGEYKGEKVVGHGGSFMGFKADYLRLPDQKYGSVLLCNLGDINPSELNKQLAEVFYGDDFKEWLKRFEGDYYSGSLDLEYSLRIEDDHLYLDRQNDPSGKLTYGDGLSFSTGNWQIEFEESKSGEIKAFTISSARAKDILFTKK